MHAPDPSAARPRKEIAAFAIFEGGGAKGIAHVGAYAAAARLGIAFAGVAGASAVAIVAALIAVGYQPEQLIGQDVAERRHLFSGRTNSEGAPLTPADLLGGCRWSRFRSAPRRSRRILCLAAGATLLTVLGGLWLDLPWSAAIDARFGAALDGLATWEPLGSRLVALLRWISWHALFGTLAAGATALLLIAAGRWLARKGALDTDAFCAIMEELLRAKVNECRQRANLPGIPDSQPWVRFADIEVQPGSGFLPLKIVATNLDLQRAEIFSQLTTPHLPVVRAIAASIAIPGVFAPVAVESARPLPRDAAPGGAGRATRYCDGGLVSNMPAWCFAVEKRIAERDPERAGAPIPVIAFTLAEEGGERSGAGAALPPGIAASLGWCASCGRLAGHATAWLRDGVDHFGRVLQTGVFGSQSVVAEFVDDLHVVRLRTGLRVLDFDADWETIHDNYRRALAQTFDELGFAFVVLPAKAAQSLERLHDQVLAILEAGGIRQAGPLRLCLFEPLPRPRARNGAVPSVAHVVTPLEFQAVHSWHMERDADDRIRVDGHSRGVPQAFTERLPVQLDLAQGPAAFHARKYERALIRSSIRSALCIPLFADAGAWEIQPPNARPVPVAVLSIDSDLAFLAPGSAFTPVMLARIVDATHGLQELLSYRQRLELGDPGAVAAPATP